MIRKKILKKEIEKNVKNKFKLFLGNNEQQAYTVGDRNARTENGFLYITAKKENVEGKGITSARLVSKRSFKYGVIEARIKVPKGKGKLNLK
jgi:beta-glucanase (GH16 family)